MSLTKRWKSCGVSLELADIAEGVSSVNGEIIDFAEAAESLSREIPEDLYVPPEALEVITTGFEGPLDLLLYLIRKNKFNIVDIPVAEIANQYAAYIDMMKKIRLDLAGNYLAMAATLAQIKSKMLLPPRQRDEDEEEEIDPRAELARRLQEYEQFKIVAESLNLRPRLGREIFLAYVETEKLKRFETMQKIELDDLMKAWKNVLLLAAEEKFVLLEREPYSVKDRVNAILAKLRLRNQIEFRELYEPEEGAAGVVVSFLATLELINTRVVTAIQADAESPIHLRLRD